MHTEKVVCFNCNQFLWVNVPDNKELVGVVMGTGLFEKPNAGQKCPNCGKTNQLFYKNK